MPKPKIYKRFKDGNTVTLYNGDCINLLKKLPDESISLIVTSPPYCMGKAYEDPHDDIITFRSLHEKVFPELYRILKPGGKQFVKDIFIP